MAKNNRQEFIDNLKSVSEPLAEYFEKRFVSKLIIYKFNFYHVGYENKPMKYETLATNRQEALLLASNAANHCGTTPVMKIEFVDAIECF